MPWQVLRQNTTLQSLCIGNDTFGDEAASVLAEGLKQNSSLTKLDFQNKVMQCCSSYIAAFSQFSQQGKQLLQGLSAVGAGSIAQAIAWRKQAVILDLSHNQLEGTGGLHDTFMICNAPISHDWD